MGAHAGIRPPCMRVAHVDDHINARESDCRTSLFR